MKTPFEEAAGLFRENEAGFGQDREKANLYHGLAMLADGLRQLEKQLAEVESEILGGPSHFYQEQHDPDEKAIPAPAAPHQPL